MNRLSYPNRLKRISCPDISGAVIFLYSDCFQASKQFWGIDVGLPVVSDKGDVVFYKLPGSCGSLAVVKQGVSAAANPPVHDLNYDIL